MLDIVPRNSFLDPQSNAARLYQTARQFLPGGNSRTTVFFPPYPPYAQSGRGAYLVDVDGQERLDCLNNYTSLIHGHADPQVVSAVASQLSLGTCFGFPTSLEIDLARLLAERVSSIDQVRFANSGSEAVMVAIQAARAFTGRWKVAKFEGCYHGSYDYAEVSVAPPVDQMGSADQPSSVAGSPGTPPSVTADTLVLPFNNVDATRQLLERHGPDLAAIIIDPMPNRAGLVPASSALNDCIQTVARRHGTLIIADEVLVFRLGFGGAQSRCGLQPDLTTLGKIIGGGFPVGVVGGRAEVMAVFDPSDGHPRLGHGGTFNANPITMVAGLETMKQLTPAAFDHLQQLGNQARAGLQEAVLRSGLVGCVTGDGSLFRVHLGRAAVHDYRSSMWDRQTAAMMNLFYFEMLANGVIIAPQGMGCLSTPMTANDISHLVEAAERALRTVGAEFGGNGEPGPRS